MENVDELWDLYTKDRQKTGRTHRRGDAMEQGQYRLAVHVCIFNSKNQLLIQQRQPFKKGWPNMWDVSVGGSATAGDSSSQAAQREVKEELGLDIDFSNLRPFFTMNFANGFDDFYIVEKEVELASLILQESEVRRVRWAGKAQVMQMQVQGIMIPYWFLGQLFDIRGSYDVQGERLTKIQAVYAQPLHLASWMNLMEIVKDEIPGLETPEGLERYRQMAIRQMKQGNAACVLDGSRVVGAYIHTRPNVPQPVGLDGGAGVPADAAGACPYGPYSKGNGERGCYRMVVHPEYRGQGILDLALALFP